MCCTNNSMHLLNMIHLEPWERTSFHAWGREATCWWGQIYLSSPSSQPFHWEEPEVTPDVHNSLVWVVVMVGPPFEGVMGKLWLKLKFWLSREQRFFCKIYATIIVCYLLSRSACTSQDAFWMGAVWNLPTPLGFQTNLAATFLPQYWQQW